jgi:hypothetical protein
MSTVTVFRENYKTKTQKANERTACFALINIKRIFPSPFDLLRSPALVLPSSKNMHVSRTDWYRMGDTTQKRNVTRNNSRRPPKERWAGVYIIINESGGGGSNRLDDGDDYVFLNVLFSAPSSVPGLGPGNFEANRTRSTASRLAFYTRAHPECITIVIIRRKRNEETVRYNIIIVRPCYLSS